MNFNFKLHKYFLNPGGKIIKKKGVEKMFCKAEKKSGHPAMLIMLGAMAAVGMVSTVYVGKRWLCKKGGKMAECVKQMVEPADFGCQCE